MVDDSPTRKETLDALRGISERRREAFRAGGLEAIPESTTADDIDWLHHARKLLSEEDQFILGLYTEVWREWGKYRCSVCGNTLAQSKAMNYDCIREC